LVAPRGIEPRFNG